MPNGATILPMVCVIAIARAAAAQSHADELTSRFLRFWDERGAPIVVIQYAFTTRDRTGRDESPVPEATFTLRQSATGGVVRDTVWRLGFNQSGGNARDHLATGIVAVPLAPGLTSWILSAHSIWSDGRSGGDPIPLQVGGLVVSDLAFGVPRTSDTWQFGEYHALLDLMRVFARQDSVHLFFQVRSEASHENVRTWITVTNVTDPAQGQRVVQMNYPIRLDAGVNTFERVLGIAKQTPGKYLVELQVGDMDGGGTSVQHGEFVVR